MKGVILAGGKGTRLLPLTKITNKHLLPVYDRPMIFFPLETLRQSGIREVLIVVDEGSLPQFKKILAGFRDVKISFAVQKKADGIAGALKLAKGFARKESIAVILGDNIFLDSRGRAAGFSREVRNFKSGGMIFLKKVSDPERFGVAERRGQKVVGIQEKPKKPKSRFAVAGLYFYDKSVFDRIKKINPSKRGELEITDVNNSFLAKNTLISSEIKGFWIDAGTFESLFRAAHLVRRKQKK